MTRISVSMLGRFTFCVDGRDIKCGTRKAVELLSSLIIERNRIQSRELIAHKLWGYCTTGQSRAYLRRALCELRKWLASAYEYDAMPLLVLDGDMIGINCDSEIDIDTDRVSAVARKYRDLPGIKLRSKHVDEIEKTLDAYEGDLLENWYEPWIDCPRRTYRNMMFSLLDEAMIYFEVNGFVARGVDVGSRMLRFDSARETTHQALMRLFYSTGNRTEALRQFRSCEKEISREFEVEPSCETVRLYQQILDDVGYSFIGSEKRHLC